LDAPDYTSLIEAANRGQILIGVDRAVARRFFTDRSIGEIQAATGEAPYLQKSVVMALFLIAPVALIASVVLAFLAVGWWGLLALIFCPAVYFAYYSYSSLGGARLLPITAVLVSVGAIHLSNVMAAPLITGFAFAFAFSLWCGRLGYSSATVFYRVMALQSAQAFDALAPALWIRRVGEH
jgi:hypothetical protein